MFEKGEDGESLSEMAMALGLDVDDALDRVKTTDNQYDRRNFVRVVFSAIEGVSYLMRATCLRRAASGSTLYTPEEIVLLREETYSLDRQGKISSQVKYLPTDGALRFSVELYMRTPETDYQLNIGGKAWDEFRKALAVRNRIAHPKSRAALTINDEESGFVLRSNGWFNFIMVTAISQAPEATEKEATNMKRTINQLREMLAKNLGINLDDSIKAVPRGK